MIIYGRDSQYAIIVRIKLSYFPIIVAARYDIKINCIKLTADLEEYV